MKIFVVLLAAVFSWSACVNLDLNDHGNACGYNQEFHRTLPAENVSVIRVNASTGDLFISQHDNDEVEIEALACASTRSDLGKINLVTTVDSSEIEITTDLSQVRNNAALDLTLRVPRNARLIITDSSGDILIENISNDIYLSVNYTNIGGQVYLP